MHHTEMKALALCSLVLLLTLVSAHGASYQSSEASGGGDGGQLGDVLLEEHMAWADGGGPDEDQDAAAAESKRAFHAMRGKKDDDDAWDSEVKRAFHAMRGKRLLAPASVDSFIAQLRRAVLQGKRGSGFFGMRGKRQLRNGQKSSRTKFVASRGRRSASGEPAAEAFF